MIGVGYENFPVLNASKLGSGRLLEVVCQCDLSCIQEGWVVILKLRIYTTCFYYARGPLKFGMHLNLNVVNNMALFNPIRGASS